MDRELNISHHRASDGGDDGDDEDAHGKNDDAQLHGHDDVDVDDKKAPHCYMTYCCHRYYRRTQNYLRQKRY